MDIFQKITALDLPKDKYVVVGGGTLVALGLLTWDKDVDICLAPEIFEAFKASGWRKETWKDKQVLKHDVYDVGIGFGEWSLEELQVDPMLIHNIPFMSLEKLLIWKKQMGRPKDLQHIELIKQYQRTRQA